MTRPACALALVLVLRWPPQPAVAQVSGAPDPWPGPAATAFTGAWSPFAIPGDLPRPAPAAPALAPGLTATPRVGLFWTGGNPAALAFEVEEARADFHLGRANASGDHRRPLDPPHQQDALLRMSAWGPVEDRSAMIGRVRFDRALLEPAHSSYAVPPYGSSPFVVVDTSRSDVTHTTAALEGAAGWRLGRFGLGLALGYAASTGRTVAAAVPRRTQVSAPAATLGLGRDFHGGALRAGLTFRWTGRAETIRINAFGADTDVFVLDGYREPEVIQLIAPRAFYRRIERAGAGAGAGLAGRAGPWRWALQGEAARHGERQWGRQVNDPPRDTWDADALRVVAGVQRPVGGRTLTLHGQWVGLSGTAARPVTEEDSGGVSLRADENAFLAAAELRQPLAPAGWGGALRLTAGYTAHDRADPRTDVSLDLQTLVTGAAVQADGRIASRLLLSGGLAVSRHQGRGVVPHPESLGPVVGDLLYGEVALHAAAATPWALAGSATFELRQDVRLWLASRYARRSPAEPLHHPFRPMDRASRSEWGITLGASLGPLDGR
ncbi:MAG TPA: hypothetical protein VM778_06280 [Gemmatimonadota bacterium]|nr:hypothetical protein [Gemmatimonadota bacterium]